MADRSPGCFGNYDFKKIAYYAKKRFVDGYSTIKLLSEAESDLEKQQIALVSMLDIEDELVLDIDLNCKYAKKCKATNCRDTLRRLIEAELNKFY